MLEVITMTFANGAERRVHLGIVSEVRGLDYDGDLVIDTGMIVDGAPYLVPLTPCCRATGKGSGASETGVVCRKCYGAVGVKYGGNTTVAVAVRTDAAMTDAE